MNENYSNQQGEERPLGQYRPNLAFYRANPKGTGCAVKMNLHPAHDDTDGCIMLTMANQLTVGNRMGPNPTFPTYDWEHALTVKLDFNDLTLVLQVLRGETESINEGKGLYHRSPRGATNIRLSHLVDPVSGYALDISRRSGKEGEETRAHFLFGPAEALGICEAIAGSIYIVAFGIPMLVPHDTAAYRAEAKAMRHAAAA